MWGDSTLLGILLPGLMTPFIESLLTSALCQKGNRNVVYLPAVYFLPYTPAGRYTVSTQVHSSCSEGDMLYGTRTEHYHPIGDNRITATPPRAPRFVSPFSRRVCLQVGTVD